jgi:hypothetical protein
MMSITKHTSSGYPFKVWREEPFMPRFDDRFLDCSLYLYPSKESANSGDKAGGSGFLIVVDGIVAGEPIPETEPPLTPDEYAQKYFHFYAVSNRHVILGRPAEKRPPSPVVRLNKHDGTHDVIDLTTNDWIYTSDQDIAVVPITHNPAHKYLFVSVTKFLTKDFAAMADVGIGDEVFMVGRLVHHDGQQRNIPSVRWGHISIMPLEPSKHPTNSTGEQESFMVEIHSVSGYSGSPVFVRPFSTRKLHVSIPVSFESMEEARKHYDDLPAGPWLLGVEWGYVRNHDQSLNNTGISGVVPAWLLIDLLNTEKLQMQRYQEQKEREEKQKNCGIELTSQ